MVRTGRIAWRRADSSVLFVDQLLATQLLLDPIAPIESSLLVKQFRKRLCKPVCNRFDHDRRIVVVFAFKLLGYFIGAMSSRHDKRTKVVLASGIDRSDVIGEASEVILSLAFPLLP